MQKKKNQQVNTCIRCQEESWVVASGQRPDNGSLTSTTTVISPSVYSCISDWLGNAYSGAEHSQVVAGVETG